MATLTPGQVFLVCIGALLAVFGFINTAGSAMEKIVKVFKAAKAPNEAQDSRLDDLEKWRKEIDGARLPARVESLEGWRTDAQSMLSNDKHSLDKINAGLEASFQVQLALLDHALNGNNVKQMQDARDGLYDYLTHPNKRKE
jgi:hypothetical protein